MASAPNDSSARLGKIHRLSPAQFAAIERVYVALVPFDALEKSDEVPQSKLDAATRVVLRACGRLSTRDPLLRALRASCPVISDIDEATARLDRCSDADCVSRVIKSARAALRKGISGSRVADRGVNATRLPRSCKRALVTPPRAYAAYRQLDAALAKLQRALATGSPDDLAAAEARLARADKASSNLPSGKRSLQRFRAGCR